MIDRIKKVMTIKRTILSLIAIFVLIWFITSGQTDISFKSIDANSVSIGDYSQTTYNVVKSTWESENDSVDYLSSYTSFEYGPLSAVAGQVYDYDGGVYLLEDQASFTFTVNVPTKALYVIAIDQVDLSSNILPNEISIEINSEYLYDESRVIELPTFWMFESLDFSTDRYGNEILPNAVKNTEWDKSYLKDSTAFNSEDLKFLLNAGDNEITISSINGEVLFGNIYIESPQTSVSYEEYLTLNTGELIDEQIIVAAEALYSKTNPSISLMSERDPSATSYDTRNLMLNAIDGWSYRQGNDEISYEIVVPETGYYYLGFKYQQDYLNQLPVFREISIDGEVPFEDLYNFAFPYTNSYQNIILNNGEEDFMFYLEEGTHNLSLRVVIDPYRNSYENVRGVMDEIIDLSLEVKKLTGNTDDKYRTWELIDYIPDIEDRFDKWIETLGEIEEELGLYSNNDNPGQLTNIKLAIDQLKDLRKDVDKIPNKMILLSDGSASASQLLGSTIQSLLDNGLDLEKIYVTGDKDLPDPETNFFNKIWESTKRFFLSFTGNDYSPEEAPNGVIEVWVNHSRQHIEVMQTMIDNEFTPLTGIEVQLSLMPDETKLILANSTNYGPDVALGVSHWIPYEFAIRGASVDMRTFDGYEELVSNFSPGVMIPYAFEEGVFGIPETQNFYVTFYRTDIFDALDLEVPDTWEEVVEMLPELQRYGMNFYEPLSLYKGFKPFNATLPFIYQFGGDLYSDNGITTTINSEETLVGMQLMTDLFTVYDLPEEVPSFYNEFRYGTLPIGISDLGTYLTLMIAAPEIQGEWDIALHPGVEQEDGSINRYAASGAQSSMILSNSELQEESFDFLEWWMSTDVQTNYALRLQTTYGTQYLWNTANLEAFGNLPLPSRHKTVILEQWEYALEASRIPGAYMVEREISNAWNSIVFNDTNPRITLDEAVKTSNREILYKMEEFGYVENGLIIKPYPVPTIYNIENWLTEVDSND